MSKIGKIFKSFFKTIYKVVDKLIVTPISRTIYNLKQKFDSKGAWVEKLLNRSGILVYFSLLLAVVVFFLVDSKVINLVETEAEIIVNIPVTTEYNKEAYVIEGLPEFVDITLIGRKSDLYLAKQLGDHKVMLDLSEYAPREEPYRVKLTYNKSINSLNYKLDPTYVSVIVKEKTNEIKMLTSDLMNQNELDPTLSVKNIDLNTTEVVVKGSKDTLDKISSVKALVDLKNPKFTDKGTYAVDNIPIVAYDANGIILDNVEIVPGKVSANITLDSYSREVKVKVLTTGNLVTGKAISNITINGQSDYTVKIYGEQSVIDKIDIVPVTIDVSDQGAKGSKTYNVAISKPTGVRHISDSSVALVVNFGDEKQRTINGVKITEPRGLGSGLIPNIKDGTPNSVTVQVKGVQSVIDSIKAENIQAFIDLTNYTTGTHTVNVQIDNDDPRLQYIVSGTLEIVISAKGNN